MILVLQSGIFQHFGTGIERNLQTCPKSKFQMITVQNIATNNITGGQHLSKGQLFPSTFLSTLLAYRLKTDEHSGACKLELGMQMVA